MRTKRELRIIAEDWAGGSIFGSWSLRRIEDWGMCFMPLLLMDEASAKRMTDGKIVHVFEDIEKSLPRSCNGAPVFMSFQGVSEAEWKMLGPMLSKVWKRRAIVEAGGRLPYHWEKFKQDHRLTIERITRWAENSRWVWWVQPPNWESTEEWMQRMNAQLETDEP